MAVIEKIRTKFGVAASIIIAVGLLLFIIDPSEIMSAVQNMSSKYDVGKIGSKSISYQDFQNDVEKYTRIHELVSGNTVSGEQEQMQVRNAAWQALVEKYLFSKNAKAAGLAVGEAENLALLTSEEYVSPLIANDVNPPFRTVVPFIRRTVPEPANVAFEKSFVPEPPNASTPLSETVMA